MKIQIFYCLSRFLKKNYQSRFFLLLIALSLSGVGVAVYKKIIDRDFLSRPSLQTYAEQVLAKCATVGYRPSCYDEEIPKLMTSLSMEEAFGVTKIIQSKDREYLYCHVLGHKLSYIEAAKNLSAWKDVIARCPTTMCNSGCLHGAVLKRFSSEQFSDSQIEILKPEFLDVCEPRKTWNPVGVEKSLCYHGVGHLAMFITNADIKKSVELCKFLTDNKENGEPYRQTCIEGLFMQIYQPLEPEDFALVKGLTPSKEEVITFCKQYPGDAFDACYRESWSLYLNEITDPKVLTRFCSYTADPAKQRDCYAIAITSVPVFFISHENSIEKMKNYCLALAGKWREFCFADAAVRLLRIDPLYASEAVEVCKSAEGAKLERKCYESLVRDATFNFRKDSDAFTNFCQLLSPSWEKQCLNT